MVFLVYLFLFSIAIVSQSYFSIRSARLYYLLAAILGVFLSLVIRSTAVAEDSDIGSYNFFMKIDATVQNQKFEPVVWEAQKFLYALIGSESRVFMITDIFALFVLAVGLKLTYDGSTKVTCCYGTQQYGFLLGLFALTLSLFPNILGMHAIYRQWVASVMVIFALAAIIKSKPIGWGAYIIAVMSHNVSFTALPLMLTLGRYSRLSQFLSVVFVVIATIFLKDFKSSTVAGELSPFILSYIISCIFSFIIIIGKKKSLLSWVFLWSIVLVVCSPFILNSNESMRLQYFFLAILFPWTWIIFISKVKNSRAVKSFLCTAVFMASMYFGSGFVF